VKKSCARRDVYDGDHLYVVYRNRSYQLDNELLLQAMRSLQDRELGVLILGFWLEWTDLKIAKELKVTDRTVRNIRSRAFEKIKKWLSLIREST
jgi:DNA-directed RNA polymerase specialized sigma24 family protein